ncbi:hypothetical protein Tsubulata_036023 [Turnera subulata]|uniref:Uncharacterized protein n=1 Tax=Turnera subulata TaxID=218843 RepID=A0A9Q0GKG8_9ROSI|nr:hypothetical protein Tsubulata_036023 [Turnera subulata]
MASNLGSCTRSIPRATYFHSPQAPRTPPPQRRAVWLTGRTRRGEILRVRLSSNDGNSYLDMWRTAVGRDRKTAEFQKIAEKSPTGNAGGGGEGGVDLDKKSEDFKKILDVSKEERDRIQRMQVIDRAAAAIAAAQAILKDRKKGGQASAAGDDEKLKSENGESGGSGEYTRSVLVSPSDPSRNGIPGPDFWSWKPPSDSNENLDDFLQKARKPSVYPTLNNRVALKERSADVLSIPFESKFLENTDGLLIPPMQSQIEAEETKVSESSLEMPSKKEKESELGVLFSVHAAEAADALNKDKVDEPYGVNPDGSRWWKETGIEVRPDGVICRWTMTRGVSVDQEVEWQEKFWEAADDFGYKELGSEKSGRDATGNVWREFWRESMSQNSGLVHLEKTADKWGKNGQGDEWQEQWWEHYDASGQTEKWAHKWCSIDPTTELDAGHAHIWHERWGEKYDGHGGSTKYTDKWAERCEGDGWSKWGDKWDENFDLNGNGVKQGESWWEGKYGDRWNRTWGEGHNGSGWVHKYGKSSSGEHWDTHAQQDTWYERFPHYGFYHCFDNSVQLREVQKPSISLEP